MASTYTVEKLGESVISLTASNSDGFTSHEILHRTDAEQLLRKLVIALYRPGYVTGVDYVSVVHNGIMHGPIQPTDPEEIERIKAQEAAEDAYFAKHFPKANVESCGQCQKPLSDDVHSIDAAENMREFHPFVHANGDRQFTR